MLMTFCNQKVEGSIPFAGTNRFLACATSLHPLHLIHYYDKIRSSLRFRNAGFAVNVSDIQKTHGWSSVHSLQAG